MAQSQVPVTSSFDGIYPAEAQQMQKARWNDLLKQFEHRYGTKCDFVSRSPGRVNIIGEHIDYSLYQCLPMAVTADVLLLVCRTREPRIRLTNSDSTRFPGHEFDVPEGEISIDAQTQAWTNYFKAGMLGASQFLRKRNPGKPLVGMDVLVNGTVPAGGGLSSSAAFVCASALAVLRANGEEAVDRTELVELAIVSERAAGVNSGGLDQSASVLSQRGSFLLVDFHPTLTTKTIPLPERGPPLAFVIAQSLVVSNKAVTGPIHYNLRVVECTLAALVLAKIFKLQKALPHDKGPLGVSLRGFHDAYFEQIDGIDDNTQTPAADLRVQLEKLVQLTEDYLVQSEGYTREETAGILGITVDELHERYTKKVTVRAERFKLRERALHVFSEAQRVQQFVEQLHAGEDPASLPVQLGALMNATQESCRELYECSCPELDELCSIARAAGAYGSRLTGAGWGGASVHLVPADKLDAVRDAWTKQYYNKRHPGLSKEELEEAIVVSRPGNGSLVYQVNGSDSI